jgi:DNA-binding transcriptional LysR family regulator
MRSGRDHPTARPASSRDQWLGIELRHLAALAAVGRERSFRAAAERLGYVQSAVSQQIAFLERLVGVRLVQRSRGPGPVSLTDAGVLLLAHIDEILSHLRAAQVDLEGLAGGLTGTVRVGVHESVAARLMPGLLDAFSRRWPDLKLTSRESSSDAELFVLVDTGSLDVAFADLPFEAGPFEACELVSDPYLLVVPADSTYARRGGVNAPDDLAGVPLIAHSSHRSMRRIEARLRAAGVEPEFVFHTDMTATAQALVGASIGAAILPRLSINLDDDAIAVVDLGDLIEPRRLGLLWHRDRANRPALEHFRAAARDVCARVDNTQARLVAEARRPAV